MDSRTKRITIVVTVIMVLMTISLVVMLNYMQTGSLGPASNNGNNTGNIETNETEDAQEEDESSVGNSRVYGDYGLDLNKNINPRAFLSDESFFDKKSSGETNPASKGENEVSLLVSSVERDLRVNIINGLGKPVEGYKFKITIKKGTETESFKDLDKDGFIYVGDLAPGSYEVKLEETDELEDLEIVKNTVSATVKEQIEYRIIDDISYLVKSEDEIDPVIDDTGINEAQKEADNTEVVERLSVENTGFGIDVSKWNKEINWKKVKAAGVDFAIIRCGYRGSSTGLLVEDPYFQKNIEGATREGIKVGIYFFTQATNAVEAVEEASIALALCGKYKLSYPIFIDTEGAGGNGRADKLDKATRTEVCKAFCDTVENSGYHAGIYASKSWFESNLEMTELSDYFIWLAQYRGQTTYKGSYDLWQYTSSGKVDGIEGRVDLNISYVGF